MQITAQLACSLQVQLLMLACRAGAALLASLSGVCRYALGGLQLFRALFARDYLLIRRHWFVYCFRCVAHHARMCVWCGTGTA